MKFSLSNNDMLPLGVRWEGDFYEVCADFRLVLKVLRVAADESVSRAAKSVLVGRTVFGTVLPADVFGAFGAFLRECDNEEADESDDGAGVAFCYEADAGEIYASFLAVYGIDLLTISFLHWAVFRRLLVHLPDDSAFREKLRLRSMDTSGLSGEVRMNAERVKRSVQLPVKLSAAERDERDAFEAQWGGGRE